MDLAFPPLNGATRLAGPSSYAVTSKMLADGAGLVADQDPHSTFGLLMSALAGAAVAVAIALTIYFQTGYRSGRDVVRHGLVAAIGLGLLAFAAYDMRNAALAYFGINPAKPAAELEIRLPNKAAATRNRPHDAFAIRYRIL